MIEPHAIFIGPITLTGRRVRLLPLLREHAETLIVAAGDGELWRLWYTAVPAPDAMLAEIDHRLLLRTQGSMRPFTAFDQASGEAVGMTTYMNMDATHRRVEIGSTWYAARAQRTGLNTEAKRLPLAHAFETLGCIAVEFRTHFLNAQSRRAIERLGAKLDGILRAHQRAKDGSLRDTCLYSSIVAAEWPAIRSHLDWRLDDRP